MKTIELLYERTDDAEVWIGENKQVRDNRPFLVVAKVKVTGGIKQVIHWVQTMPTKRYCTTLAKKHGILSPRPYVLAQGCDGTIDNCVHALAISFCKVHGLNYVELYKQAYEDERGDDVNESEIVRLGEWEGVTYPEKWDDEAVAGLLESLHAINNHMFAGVIDEEYHKLKNGVPA